MGKLVLTRRAGESVKLVEANGREWLIKFCDGGFWKGCVTVARCGEPSAVRLAIGQAYTFAGGSLELRPTKRRWPGQAILAFDFPRDVKIVRTEIA